MKFKLVVIYLFLTQNLFAQIKQDGILVLKAIAKESPRKAKSKGEPYDYDLFIDSLSQIKSLKAYFKINGQIKAVKEMVCELGVSASGECWSDKPSRIIKNDRGVFDVPKLKKKINNSCFFTVFVDEVVLDDGTVVNKPRHASNKYSVDDYAQQLSSTDSKKDYVKNPNGAGYVRFYWDTTRFNIR